MTPCKKDWGGPHIWYFCSLPLGHEGPCSSGGRVKRDDELYFFEQPEVIAAHQKDWQTIIAKEAKKHSAVDRT